MRFKFSLLLLFFSSSDSYSLYNKTGFSFVPLYSFIIPSRPSNVVSLTYTRYNIVNRIAFYLITLISGRIAAASVSIIIRFYSKKRFRGVSH